MKAFLRGVISLLIKYIKYNKLRDLLLWPVSKRVFGHGYKEEILIENGVKMFAYGDMADMVNKTLLFNSQYMDLAWEPATSRFLKSILSKNKVAVVAGSHIGYYPLIISKGLNKVYAFEPNPINYERLVENIKLNKFENIITENIALGDRAEEQVMYFDSGQSSLVKSSRGYVDSGVVKVDTLDSFFAQKTSLPDLMIFDAEGYEPKILKGAESIIDNNRPDIIFEINPRSLSASGSSVRELCSFLLDKGYKIYTIEDDYDHSFDIKYSGPVKLLPYSGDNLGSISFINAFASVSGIV